MAGLDDIGKELEKKGPGNVPVWAYGVGLAALVVGWQFLHKPSSATGATGASGGTGQTLPQTTTSTTISGGGGTAGRPPWWWWMTLRNPDKDKTGFHPKTDAQWAKLAEDWLIGKGEDPKLVSDAIDDYLHRQELSGEESALVDMAVRAWHLPPEGGPWKIIREDDDDKRRKALELKAHKGGHGPKNTTPVHWKNGRPEPRGGPKKGTPPIPEHGFEEIE